MTLLQQFIDEAKSGNAVGLSELFDCDGRIDDSCIEGMFHTETHLFGKEAIDMHYYNRFVFKTYLVLDGEVLDDTHAVMDVMIVGQQTKVNLILDTVSEDGKITHLSMNPA